MTAPRGAALDFSSHLLDRELPAEYRREWTAHVAEEAAAVQRGTVAVLVFRVGTEWFALPIGVLQTIAPPAPVHSIPHHTNGLLRGVTNVRGELLLCIALQAIVGGESQGSSPNAAADGTAQQRMLVVAAPGGSFVLPVDEVYGVHRYLPDTLRDVPATLTNATIRYTIGLIPWRDRTVAQLDEGAIFIAVQRALA